MPHRDYLGLWEALMYEGILKQDLLSYANAALLFSDKGVDPQVVSFNRVLLLHGPPGTGKTSLCKALAQKLSVRLQHRYSDSQLIEINSHSLFSRWFSESGKLVTKLFTRIRSLVSDPDSFVCVLIDEVESLTAARRSGGNEPSDAIRVVNALLTQIDSLKHYTNTLVLTTSNITGAIDLAFVDRADFKAYVPNPSLNCRYEIIRSAVHELVSKGVLVGSRSVPRFSHSFLESEAAPMDVHGTQQQQQYQQSFRSANEWRDFNSPETWGRWLAYIASLCEDFSGRALRKLPFQAFIIQGEVVGVADFLAALEQATRKEISARTSVDEGTTDMSRRTTASGREST
uniref:AAA+ ATPase domain-containing protein n=1 Tax=Vitrella brassicaformis TaxID=1169539 RepID=A0A7S1P1G3_9ALVE